MELLAEDSTVRPGCDAGGQRQHRGQHDLAHGHLVFRAARDSDGCPAAADQRHGHTRRTASATVTWAAPSNGGSAITSYTVTPYVDARGADPDRRRRWATPPTPCRRGLTNGTAYTFTVTATNAIRHRHGIGAVQRPVTPSADAAGPVVVAADDARSWPSAAS